MCLSIRRVRLLWLLVCLLISSFSWAANKSHPAKSKAKPATHSKAKAAQATEPYSPGWQAGCAVAEELNKLLQDHGMNVSVPPTADQQNCISYAALWGASSQQHLLAWRSSQDNQIKLMGHRFPDGSSHLDKPAAHAEADSLWLTKTGGEWFDLPDISPELIWQIEGLTQNLGFNKLNTLQIRIHLDSANEGFYENPLKSVEWFDDAGNFLDAAIWFDRADALGTFICASGSLCEVQLWKSPLREFRLSRGVGKSNLQIRRQTVVRKSATGKKTRQVVIRSRGPHMGVDYAAPVGSPISAVANGEIIYAGYNGNFGNLVVIDHGSGVQTYYAHLSEFADNTVVGHTVKRGEYIGAVGSTGRSTGPHLHHEIRKDGAYINPDQLSQFPKFWQLSDLEQIEILVRILNTPTQRMITTGSFAKN
jgi:murein DD-endopeptidase MepM/ murein hydrolase activator NlpD